MLKKQQTIDLDLVIFNLGDIVQKMKDENFFAGDKTFHLEEEIDNNCIVFGVPRDRSKPARIHEFRYDPIEKKLQIKSRCKSILTVRFILPLLLILLFLAWQTDDVLFSFTILLLSLVVNLFFTLIGILVGFKGEIEYIQRELLIRWNYLLRQKGYPARL